MFDHSKLSIGSALNLSDERIKYLSDFIVKICRDQEKKFGAIKPSIIIEKIANAADLNLVEKILIGLSAGEMLATQLRKIVDISNVMKYNSNGKELH